MSYTLTMPLPKSKSLPIVVTRTSCPTRTGSLTPLPTANTTPRVGVPLAFSGMWMIAERVVSIGLMMIRSPSGRTVLVFFDINYFARFCFLAAAAFKSRRTVAETLRKPNEFSHDVFSAGEQRTFITAELSGFKNGFKAMPEHYTKRILIGNEKYAQSVYSFFHHKISFLCK